MNDFDFRENNAGEVSMIADFEGDISSVFNQDIDPELPILPLRNLVIFPSVITPVSIGRKSSLKVVQECFNHQCQMGVICQRDSQVEAPAPQDLYDLGVVVRIIRILEMPDGNVTAILQGQSRFEVEQMNVVNGRLIAHVHKREDLDYDINDNEFNTVVNSCREMATKLINLITEGKGDMTFAIRNIHNSLFLINFCSTNLPFSPEEKMQLLTEDYLINRAYLLLRLMGKACKLAELRRVIQQRTQEDLNQQQKEFFLQQELRNIQDELGNSVDNEINDMAAKAEKMQWSEEINTIFHKELGKLERIAPQSPDYNVQLNYLQTMLALPWGVYSEDNLDINHAERVLNRDHYGMEKVKERILEHLAVLKMRGDFKSPIICLYGPPGVGKTSLGKSIAASLKRKYVRISLGGLHDEAEIRGHRRTYIGAMPGRIIKSLQKAGTSNPVFVLDEIDKVSQNTPQGDPAAALLEVLDPEQNNTFHDNFLDVDYDLSKIMFIATANDLSTIPSALRDRMELIEVPGYITEEKIEIARKHLIPKIKKELGINRGYYTDIKLGKPTIEKIIECYTRESGVRQLEKKISKVFRKEALQYARENFFFPNPIRPCDLKELLGTEEVIRDKYQGNNYAGVVTGLAWTSVGGEILLVEAGLSKGKSGKLTLTGSLGDVMKESAILAVEYIKSHADMYRIDPRIFEHWDIHIHVPDGATPKDGPSAGITLVTALISALTQRKVRKNIAMTGEITLRGRVSPVGGIREKILAAKRAGIKDIVLCRENQCHIEEIPAMYLEGLEFHYVTDVKEVIDFALLDEKVAHPIDFIIPEESKK